MTRALTIAAALVLCASARANAQYVSRAAVVQPASLDTTGGTSHSAGAVTGALWGGAVGAGIGLLGAATGDSCTNSGNGTGTHCTKLSGDEKVIVVTAVALAGTIVGSAIGAVIGKHVEMSSQDRVQLQLTPSHAQLHVVF